MRLSIRLVISILFFCSFSIADPLRGLQDVNIPNVVIDGFNDVDECYNALENADENGDRLIDAEEYVTVVQELAPPGSYDDVESFADLPFVLQTTFGILACLCRTDAGDDACCVGANATLDTAGAFEGETPTDRQKSYLFFVCSYTNGAINSIESESPSFRPSPTPTTPAPTTPVPTAVPSETPSLEPTREPSTSPSSSPTKTPVPTSPTASPSEAPSQPLLNITVNVTYEIAIPGNIDQSVYIPQLERAMDSLAPEVLAFSGIERQRRLGRRRLQTVALPTVVTEALTLGAAECNSSLLIDPQDICQAVTAEILLLFQPSDPDPLGTAEQFQLNLESAINDGDLQDALDSTSPNAAVYILSGRTPSTQSTDPDEGQGISAGGVAGIALASFVGVGILIGLLATRRQEPKGDLEELHPAPQNLDLAEGDTDTAKAQARSLGEGELLGATSPDYGNPEDKMVDLDDERSTGHKSHGSSASAGSSGWSSSAGVSSLNTGSADGLELDPASGTGGLGTTLAAMSAQSKPPLGDTASDTPVVSRSDLDSAIESGDWAAVGATAALLAAASDSQSYSSHSQSRSAMEGGSGGKSGTTSTSSLDAARAAELDHLVDAGDWEGVVLAAARYEASESESQSRSESRSAANTQDSSLGSSPSKQQKRKEMRAIVEELVRRVVPEEIQNVDEMMLQFRGREEELIETLRTMEERAVAQKARQGAQKAAKLEAKQAVSAARAAGTGSQKRQKTEEADVSSKSLGTGQVSASSKSTGSGDATSRSLGTGSAVMGAKAQSIGKGAVSTEAERKVSKQTALERAIEAGDWEAVGEAAAMLSDHASTASPDTEEINRLAEGISSQASTGTRSVGADELDDLIDKGDWTGVVQAASKYDKPKEKVLTKEEEEAVRRERRLKHLQAEQEALQQADIWMAIAEQSAAEATTTEQEAQGAKEAVDWAISRSLGALVAAEAQGTLRDRSKSPPAGDKSIPDEDAEEEV